jgi:hypothetical protein
MESSTDHSRRSPVVAMLCTTVLVAAACTSRPSPLSTPSPGSTPSAVATPGSTESAPPAATSTPRPPAFARNPAPIVEGTPYRQSIDPADFVASVDHPFLPLAHGAKFVFDGDEHVEVTVLPETKVILGVATTAVHDQVFVDGVLEEDTLDYYAQDRDGNVWYFGETTAELDKNGKVTSTAGSWIGGEGGAYPGIVMLARPQAGDSYRQEYLAGEAEDLAVVTALTGTIKVMGTTRSGADVLVTEEWTPLEPDVRERKTYVWDLGVVESRMIKGGTERTTLSSYTAP